MEIIYVPVSLALQHGDFLTADGWSLSLLHMSKASVTVCVCTIVVVHACVCVGVGANLATTVLNFSLNALSLLLYHVIDYII